MNGQFGEFMTLKAMLGGTDSVVWVQLVLLLMFTAIVCFRRQVIVRLKSFRLAFMWLSLSFIAPGILAILAPLVMGVSTRGRSGVALFDGLYGFIFGANQTVAPLLVGIAVFCFYRAIVPTFIPPADAKGDNETPF